MQLNTNGLSQGDLTLLNALHDGSMTNILTLIGSLGGGVDSENTPLTITGCVLTIDLSSYKNTTGLLAPLADKASTSHAANNVGITNVDFGDFDLHALSVTLEKPNGATALLTVDNGAHLLINGHGFITVNIFTLWSYHNFRIVDSGGNVRLLITNFPVLSSLMNKSWSRQQP